METRGQILVVAQAAFCGFSDFNVFKLRRHSLVLHSLYLSLLILGCFSHWCYLTGPWRHESLPSVYIIVTTTPTPPMHINILSIHIYTYTQHRWICILNARLCSKHFTIITPFHRKDTEGQKSYYVASKVTQPVIELGFPPRRLALEHVLLLTMSYCRRSLCSNECGLDASKG